MIKYIRTSFIFEQDILSQIAVFLLAICLRILVTIIYKRIEMGKIRAIYFYHKAVSFSLGIVALVFGFWQRFRLIFQRCLMNETFHLHPPK